LPEPFPLYIMTQIKTLDQLFLNIPEQFRVSGLPATPITGISLDSRTIKGGEIFVAMKGVDGKVDGHSYIDTAIKKGAGAVVGEKKDVADLPVPYVQLKNTRQALTWIAAAFHDFPGRKMTVIGVTGTDGKTTTTNLIHKILLEAGFKAGMVSTVNAVIGDEVLDTGFHVTTPDAHDVQRYLAQMVQAGLTHVVLETTSHGWSQYRVDACEFDIGVVTNITHEHMNEHGSYENYRAAKARLFSSLEVTTTKSQGNPRLGVINRDDDKSFNYLDNLIKVNKINYGLASGSDITALNIQYSPSGIQFIAKGPEFEFEIKSSLVGAYNVSNCLAAITATIRGLNIDPKIVSKGIANLEGIPGRMERIDLGQDFTAIVDFAHTPNALKSALEAARTMTEGRVIAVFGSAGLRDKEKRRMMAETSAELADFTVLTAEDPRTESLDGILDEMAAGARSKGGNEMVSFWRVADRGEAIRFALTLAQPGDIVLSCGKGHEQSMCFGEREHLWDDRAAMRAALSEYLNVDGPQMPYLPTQNMEEKEWLHLK